MGTFMKVVRWVVMIVGCIELLGNGGRIVSGDTSNSAIYPFIFWVVLVFTAGYFEYYANKKRVLANKAENDKTSKS
jgi:hypothetical protein